MFDFDRWQTVNEAYLSSSLEWLRSRLQSAIEADTHRANEFTEFPSDAGEYQPALELLAARVGLSDFEKQVLLLCAAIEFDTRIASLCALAQEDSSRPYPTFALAMSLFDDPTWDALSPQRPLRQLRLLELNQPGSTPLTVAALRADERIVNYLKGLNSLDDRLTPLLMPFDTDDDIDLPDSQQAAVAEIVSELNLVLNDVGERLPLIQLAGADSSSKQLVAQRAAQTLQLELYRIPADVIPSDFHEQETFLRLWEREHRLLPIALYVDASESDSAAFSRLAAPLNRFLARATGLIFVDLPELRVITGRTAIMLDIAKPTAEEQRSLWTSLIHDPQAACELAGQFSLNATTIQRVARSVEQAKTTRSVSEELSKSNLHDPSLTYQHGLEPASDRHRDPVHAAWNACRRATRPRLESLAQRIEAKATWNDLVLPADETQQLRDIADQIQHRSRVYDDWGFRAKHNRGLGVSVLFAGESGTGKTMAAEVIANDLQLDLYRIDLSAVVNKYIGETEKNLAKLFDAADDSGAILFFDEADSLFGKRTEVKDSHDRYANLEVNYLLQRMEAYRGLAILATNLKGSLDQAFLRRLRFIVSFPLPDAAQRRELWRKAFPSETPLAPIDLDRLARLNVTGGNIHTIALNAAFASANDGPQLSMPHILKAARGEYRKLQKPINAADFRTTDWKGSVG